MFLGVLKDLLYLIKAHHAEGHVDPKVLALLKRDSFWIPHCM
jgi:hypothetical protein